MDYRIVLWTRDAPVERRLQFEEVVDVILQAEFDVFFLRAEVALD